MVVIGPDSYTPSISQLPSWHSRVGEGSLDRASKRRHDVTHYTLSCLCKRRIKYVGRRQLTVMSSMLVEVRGTTVVRIVFAGYWLLYITLRTWNQLKGEKESLSCTMATIRHPLQSRNDPGEG